MTDLDVTSNHLEPPTADEAPPIDSPATGPAPARRAARRGPRRRLRPSERRDLARQAYRESGGTLTGEQLAEQFGMSDRWGRAVIADLRAEDAGDVPAGMPEADDEPVDDEAPAGPPDVLAKVTRLIAVLIGIVVLAPIALSFHSLADYAGDTLGLDDHFRYVFPTAVDAAALACVALVFHAVLSGDGSAGPRILLWLLVAASSALNYRHGKTISPDAGPVYAAMPIVGATLLDLWLRRLRRGVLRRLGVIEAPLARYRLARWVVAPRETLGAWTTSVRENVSSPVDALALYRDGASARRAEKRSRKAAAAPASEMGPEPGGGQVADG